MCLNGSRFSTAYTLTLGGRVWENSVFFQQNLASIHCGLTLFFPAGCTNNWDTQRWSPHSLIHLLFLSWHFLTTVSKQRPLRLGLSLCHTSKGDKVVSVLEVWGRLVASSSSSSTKNLSRSRMDQIEDTWINSPLQWSFFHFYPTLLIGENDVDVVCCIITYRWVDSSRATNSNSGAATTT